MKGANKYLKSTSILVGFLIASAVFCSTDARAAAWQANYDVKVYICEETADKCGENATDLAGTGEVRATSRFSSITSNPNASVGFPLKFDSAYLTIWPEHYGQLYIQVSNTGLTASFSYFFTDDPGLPHYQLINEVGDFTGNWRAGTFRYESVVGLFTQWDGTPTGDFYKVVVVGKRK